MFLLLLLYHYIYICFYFLQRFTWRQWRFNQQNGDQDYYVVVIYLFIYLFIYLLFFSWINGWDDISVCEAKKPRYAVPIMEGYKKILLVAGGTQLRYVTAAYISCSLDTLSDHQSMGSQGDFSMAEYVVHVISIDTRPGKQPHNYGKIQNPPFSSWVNPLFLWQFTKGSVSYLSSPCFSTIIGGIGGPARGKRRILDVMFRHSRGTLSMREMSL